MTHKNALRSTVLALLALVLLILPASAKYIHSEASLANNDEVTVVWSEPRLLNGKGWGGNNDAVQETFVITEGVNDGWYAVIAWGGCGGRGRNNTYKSYFTSGGAIGTINEAGTNITGNSNGAGPGSGFGLGGCAKAIIRLDAGTYTARAGGRGDMGRSDYNGGKTVPGGWNGGGLGYDGMPSSRQSAGGGGGGWSGIIKHNNDFTGGSARVIAGGGGGSGGRNPNTLNSNGGGHGGGARGGYNGFTGTAIMTPTGDEASFIPGGSARRFDAAADSAGTATDDRGAGGGVEHQGRGGSPKVMNGGGRAESGTYHALPGATWVRDFHPITGRSRSGGDAGGDYSSSTGTGGSWGGGGGGGFYGGGGGALSSSWGHGGGGGGSTYIHNGSSYAGTGDLQTGDGAHGFAAATGDRALPAKLAAWLDSLNTGRGAIDYKSMNGYDGYNGCVLWVYLGPEDPRGKTDADYVYNW